MLYYVNDTQEKAARRPITAPAPTIMFGARSNGVYWLEADDEEDPS